MVINVVKPNLVIAVEGIFHLTVFINYHKICFVLFLNLSTALLVIKDIKATSYADNQFFKRYYTCK